jgi:hypothetical protein
MKLLLNTKLEITCIPSVSYTKQDQIFVEKNYMCTFSFLYKTRSDIC